LTEKQLISGLAHWRRGQAAAGDPPTHFEKREDNRGNIEDEADAVGIGHIGLKPLLPIHPEFAQGLGQSGNAGFTVWRRRWRIV
jgi:hypothetical protein